MIIDPIIVNIGNVDHEQITELLNLRIPEFNQLNNNQKQKIIEFIASLNHQLLSAIEDYLPQQTNQSIINHIQNIIRFINRII